MLETSLKILKKINEAGYQAYIVGGFVRDYLLGNTSQDVDICTSATPKELRSIFSDAYLPHEEYGSVTLVLHQVRFEITTFRKELKYEHNRKPVEIRYIDSLEEDLLRRDFTINTLCMDQDGNIIDLLNGRQDLQKGIIQTVGDSTLKFTEDSLRILRAIRFATSLNFKLSDEVVAAIQTTKHFLKGLSYQRKKDELDRIFLSPNVTYGVSLLITFGLDEILEIPKLGSITSFDDLMGVWAMLEVDDRYPFTKNERDLMKEIRNVYPCNVLDPMVLYQHKLYVCSVVGRLKGIDPKKIAQKYVDLPIHLRTDINITAQEICRILNKPPGPFLKEAYVMLEECILKGDLINQREKIVAYLQSFSSES